MASSESSSANSPREWAMLASLFTPEGGYRHRMGLRRATAAEFYAPTPAGPVIHAEKEAILKHAGDRHTLSTPEGHEAAAEFASALGLPTEAISAADDGGEQAFNHRLGLALEPDLLFVQPPNWTLVWANVCFPTRWSLEGKCRRPLTWIHEPVPDLNAELADKIAVFFSRLAPDEGWRRANWGLSASAQRNQHPDEVVPPLDVDTPLDQIFVRVEDQHLLKLPGTGSVALGIRIVNFGWPEVMARPGIAAPLLGKLRSMSAEISRYKGLERIIPSLQMRYP